jgi:hypothetical protein
LSFTSSWFQITNRLKFKKELLMKLVLAGLTLLGVLNTAHALVVVQDHAPQATIVVDKNSSEQVRQAAKTLQEYVQQSTGATLPISTEAASGKTIHVGRSTVADKAGINATRLDEDGFILRGTNDNNFYIVGGSDWGTEFGVYDFLERYVGVRWLMPTEIGVDVPHRATLDIPATPVRQEPVYLSRQLSPMNNLDTDQPAQHWARFNRARGRIAHQHNFYALFPVSQFGATHPEFYPLLDGKRYLPKNDTDELWQINFSAPGVVDASVERVEEYFQAHPDAESYSLAPNDWSFWDQSPASLARRSGKQNYLGFEDVSDDYFQWANAVAEKVLLKYPDKWFGTLAYAGLAEPPTKTGVNPRIIPFITDDRMRWEDAKLREIGQNLTERWGKVAPHLGWYDYNYGHSYLLPRVYFHRMQKYLQWGVQHQVKYHYSELYPNWGEGPKPWIMTKLLWDPNQNVDDLLDDWYTHFAGSQAAPKLKDFYAVWEKFWTTDIYKSAWYRDTGIYLEFNIDPTYLLDVPQTYVTQSDEDIKAALQLADTPERKARVAKLQQMWELYKTSIIAYQGTNRLASFSDPQSADEALKLLEQAEQVMADARRRQEILASFHNDSLYQYSVGYINRNATLNGINWGTSYLWNVLPWVKQSTQVEECLQNLANSSNATAKEQAKLVLEAAKGTVQLVSQNPSFEDGTNGWVIWDKFNEPPGYHKGIWTVSTAVSKSGTNSLQVKGLERGAPLQSIPYIAGSYFAVAHCFVPKDGITSKAKASIVVQSLGQSLQLPSLNIVLQPGAWTKVVVPFKLPPSSVPNAKIRLMVLLDGFHPDAEIYLDDVGIYRFE